MRSCAEPCAVHHRPTGLCLCTLIVLCQLSVPRELPSKVTAWLASRHARLTARARVCLAKVAAAAAAPAEVRDRAREGAALLSDGATQAAVAGI